MKRRDGRISLRLTASEEEALRDAARRRGVTVSEFIRTAVLHELVGRPPTIHHSVSQASAPLANLIFVSTARMA